MFALRHGTSGRWEVRAFCGSAGLWAALAVAASAGQAVAADSPPKPIQVDGTKVHTLTFSELVVRLEASADIGVAKQGIKLEILEELRKQGYRALGAENLVFGKDEAANARFVLGGTLRELDCRGFVSSECRIAIQWELLDRATDEVVYKVLTRARGKNLGGDAVKAIMAVIRGSLHSLLSREKFVEHLRIREEPAAPEAEAPRAATFRACAPANGSMPAAAEQVLAATVLVESGEGFGTGFLVSPDGYMLTAAHVVRDSRNRVRFQNGQEHQAEVVRISPKRDVALLKLAGTGFSCIALDQNPAKVGDRVFAIGSPASKQLAFSLTAGIVSGLRDFEGQKFLQTDASINRGNSGGPMLSEQSRALAIVTWKLAGLGLEGVAFGVPTSVALQALGLSEGAASDESLAAERTDAAKGRASQKAFEDVADPAASLDHAAGLRDAQVATAPAAYRLLRSGGIALTILSSIGIGYTYVAVKGGRTPPTEADFASARAINNVSWVALPVGIAAILASKLLLRPAEAPVVVAGGAMAAGAETDKASASSKEGR